MGFVRIFSEGLLSLCVWDMKYILPVFVHLSACVWPWPNWGDKPTPIDGNWSAWSARIYCRIPSEKVKVSSRSHRESVVCSVGSGSGSVDCRIAVSVHCSAN